MGLRVRRLSKSFGKVAAIRDISFDLKVGQCLALLGPSGCGKSTTLSILAGFTAEDSGTVEILGRDVTGVPSARRNIGMVFQNYALFPHMTTEDNVGYGLRVRRTPQAERRQRVGQALDLVSLGDKAKRYTRELSGGEQQRVALVRALVVQPDLLLLDEPLSNLDAGLRDELRREIRRIQRQSSVTTVFVTHDQREAFGVGDLIAVVFDGMIRQIGTPEELYARPTDERVARFIGRANVVSGQVVGVNADGYDIGVGGGVVRVPQAACAAPGLERGDQVSIIVQPEVMRLGKQGAAGGDNSVEVTITEVEYLGAAWHTTALTQDGTSMQITSQGLPEAAAGSPAVASWTPERAWLVPAGGVQGRSPES
jgi:putative spermidine/putrescine transport system ATP-binding protein